MLEILDKAYPGRQTHLATSYYGQDGLSLRNERLACLLNMDKFKAAASKSVGTAHIRSAMNEEGRRNATVGPFNFKVDPHNAFFDDHVMTFCFISLG